MSDHYISVVPKALLFCLSPGPLFPNPDGRGERWWAETSMRRTWGSAAKKAAEMDDRLLAQLMGERDTRSSVEKHAKLDSHAIRAGLDRLHSKKDPDE